MASIWQKKKSGIWCITYWEDGKQKARSLRTTSKRDATKLQREIEAELKERGEVTLIVADRTKLKPANNPRLDDFWKEFHEWAKVNRSRPAADEYKTWFNQLKEFTKADRLGDVTRVQIEGFKTQLLKQGKNKPKGVGLSKTSVNSGLKTLRSIWNQAVQLGMFTGENPFEGVEKFKLPQMPNKEYLTEDQITSLLDAAQKHAKERNVKVMEGQNLYLAIALMALAGLRKREACFAKWDWIDWEKRTIQVTNDATFVTKNKKPRTISMNKKLVEILAPHKKDAGYILENVRTNKGKSRYRVDFDRGFRRACEIAEIKATPHALRHSFASRHAVAGTSLHVIAGWLGHSTTWITERYTHFQTNFNDAADNI